MENSINFNKTYTEETEKLIENEFFRLKDNCYLDHTGATLYSEKQIQDVMHDLSSNLYGNPHAGNSTSKATQEAMDMIRIKILEQFNTNSEEYSIVFTSGATGALKMIAENFNYDNGILCYLEDNHTSVLGMRQYSKNVTCVPRHEAFNIFNNEDEQEKKQFITNHNSNSLFIYSAQCNFTGYKYPLNWIRNVKNGALNNFVSVENTQWYTVLDAASYCSTNILDLSTFKPDFVTISFYKMFGYPTGLGAVLIRNCSVDVLHKRYYGGGTVLMAISTKNIHVPKTDIQESFEDGTLPFLSILSLQHGFETIKRLKLNFDLISKNTFSLAQYLYKQLTSIHHFNGTPCAILYSDSNYDNIETQGGIINFNLLRSNGEYVGYSEVLYVCNLNNIQIRTGCFCNPGACQRHLKLTVKDIQKQFDAGHVCGDQIDLIDGYPTGSIRVSFGYMSTIKDVDKFLKVIQDNFIDKPIIYKNSGIKIAEKKDNTLNKKVNNIKLMTNDLILKDYDGTIDQIFLYPIKSCAALQVKNTWKLTNLGLKYDREWMIVNAYGISLTQKHNKKLCHIKPLIDLEKNVLILTLEDYPNCEISLKKTKYVTNDLEVSPSKVCGIKTKGIDCGDEVAEWLSYVLDCEGLRLLRHFHDKKETINNKRSNITFANKAQFLLINKSSVVWLLEKMTTNTDSVESMIRRFRPNFVVDLGAPFIENICETFTFDEVLFKMFGKCHRCQMICIDQFTAEVSKEPLATLSRELKGDISFGIYLNRSDSDDVSIKVGCCGKACTSNNIN